MGYLGVFWWLSGFPLWLSYSLIRSAYCYGIVDRGSRTSPLEVRHRWRFCVRTGSTFDWSTDLLICPRHVLHHILQWARISAISSKVYNGSSHLVFFQKIQLNGRNIWWFMIPLQWSSFVPFISLVSPPFSLFSLFRSSTVPHPPSSSFDPVLFLLSIDQQQPLILHFSPYISSSWLSIGRSLEFAIRVTVFSFQIFSCPAERRESMWNDETTTRIAYSIDSLLPNFAFSHGLPLHPLSNIITPIIN